MYYYVFKRYVLKTIFFNESVISGTFSLFSSIEEPIKMFVFSGNAAAPVVPFYFSTPEQN